eukprot:585394-Prymnesium_polylepis.1
MRKCPEGSESREAAPARVPSAASRRLPAATHSLSRHEAALLGTFIVLARRRHRGGQRLLRRVWVLGAQGRGALVPGEHRDT